MGNMILLYGQPGVGKTCLAGTAGGKGKKVHWLDLDDGSESLDIFSEKIKKDIKVTKIQSVEALEREYEKLSKIRDSIIVIDHLTELQELCMDGFRGKAESVFKKQLTSRQHRLRLNIVVKDIIRDLKVISVKGNNLVICLAHETYDDKKLIIHPDVAGKLGMWVCGVFSMVGRLEMLDGGRILRIKEYKDEEEELTIIAKSRKTSRTAIKSPTIPKLLFVLEGKKEVIDGAEKKEEEVED